MTTNVSPIGARASYRRRLSPTDFGLVLDDIEASLRSLKAEGPLLLARARTSKQTLSSDGFPRSVRPLVGSGGGGYGSSVESAVIPDEREDPLWTLTVDMCEAVRTASDLLRHADGAWQKAKPASKPCWKCDAARDATDEWCRCGAPATRPGVPNCIVHERFELESPVWKASRCRTCYQYRLDHDGADATEEYIRALEDKRIDRQMRNAA